MRDEDKTREQLLTELGELREQLRRQSTVPDFDSTHTPLSSEFTAMFHTLLEIIPAGVVVCDGQGNIVLDNAEARSLLGGRVNGTAFGPETGYGLFRSDGTPYPPDCLPLPRALEGSATSDVEILVRQVGGDTRTILAAGTPLLGDSGEILEALALFQDISETKAYENALRESETKFRTMADHAPVLLWMSGTDGACTFFNKGWLDSTGRSLEEELGYRWLENVHTEDRERCMATYLDSFERRSRFQMEYRLKHHRGEYRWVLDTGVPRFAPNGDFVGYIGSCLDITDTKLIKSQLEQSEEKFRSIFERAGIGIALVDMEAGRILESNASLHRILGYQSEELQARTFTDITHPADMAKDIRAFTDLVAGKLNSYQMVKRYIHKDGHLVWGHLVSSLVRSESGRPLYAIGMLEDITDRKLGEERLQWDESLLQAMAHSSPLGFLVVDGRTRDVLYTNRRFFEIWDLAGQESYQSSDPVKCEEILDQCALKVAESTDLAGFCGTEVSGSGPYDGEVIEDEIPLKDGRIVRRFSTEIRNNEGLYFGRFFVFEDITERKQLEAALSGAKLEAEKAREEAERMASIDYLTGTLNRRAFIEGLAAELSRARRKALSVSLILTDIDFFKRVNDTYGHQVGDVVLQGFAQSLRENCRAYDLIGRYGGEEFIICLPDTSLSEAVEIAERMRQATKCRKTNWGDSRGEVQVTASFGVASIESGDHQSTETIDAFIHRTDEALYTAKHSGRDCVKLAVVATASFPGASN